MPITLQTLKDRLGLTVFAGADLLNREITGGYASDLLSDVMGNAREGEIWITLQAHKNIVAVASLRDLPAVLLVQDIRPDADTVRAAEAEEIVLLGTPDRTFDTAGRIHRMLHPDTPDGN